MSISSDTKLELVWLYLDQNLVGPKTLSIELANISIVIKANSSSGVRIETKLD